MPHPSRLLAAQNGRLPLHIAVEEGASAEVVALLVAADMPITHSGEPSTTHLHSWFWLVDQDSPAWTRAIELLLAPLTDEPPGCGYGTHIAALSEALDTEGRTALKIAKAKPRQVIYKYLLLCGRYELQPGAPEHRSATSVVLRALDRSDKPDFGKVFDTADKDESGTLSGDELSAVARSLGLSTALITNESRQQGPRDSTTTAVSVDKPAFVGACKRLLGDGPRQVWRVPDKLLCLQPRGGLIRSLICLHSRLCCRWSSS